MQQVEIFNLFLKILRKKKSFYYDNSYLNIPWILVTASAEIKKTYILKVGNEARRSIDGKPSFKGHWSFSNNKQSLVLNFEGEDATIYDLGFYNDTFMLLRQEEGPYQLFFSEEKLNEIPKGSDPILYKRLNAVKVLANQENALNYLDYVVNQARMKRKAVLWPLIISGIATILAVIYIRQFLSGSDGHMSDGLIAIGLTIIFVIPSFLLSIGFLINYLIKKRKINNFK